MVKIMNKNIIIALASSSIAFAGGILTGYLFTKKKYHKKMNQELDSIRAYYEEKRNNTLPKTGELEPKVEITLDNQTSEQPIITNGLDDLLKDYKSEDNEKPKRKYTKKGGQKVSDNKIREIGLEQYEMSPNNCETLALYSNGIMLDSSGIQVNPEEYIGHDGLLKAMEMMNSLRDFSDLYFANDNLNIDFEVELIDEAYSA